MEAREQLCGLDSVTLICTLGQELRMAGLPSKNLYLLSPLNGLNVHILSVLFISVIILESCLQNIRLGTTKRNVYDLKDIHKKVKSHY